MAAHWLADGHDGKSLQHLAGLIGKDPPDVRDALGDALAECDIEIRNIAEQAAAMVAFTAIAQLQVSGRAAERWVVSKVCEIVGSDLDTEITRLPLGRLHYLDEEWAAEWGRAHDQIARRGSASLSGSARHGLRQLSTSPARRIVAGQPSCYLVPTMHRASPGTVTLPSLLNGANCAMA